MVKISLCNMRLTGIDKNFYLAQLKEFAEKFNSEKVLSVQFGKQDIRGGVSITIIDKSHCIPKQKFFTNKWEMLGFICGFNEAKNKTGYSDFGRFLK